MACGDIGDSVPRALARVDEQQVVIARPVCSSRC
jgi:hypothetical protein